MTTFSKCDFAHNIGTDEVYRPDVEVAVCSWLVGNVHKGGPYLAKADVEIAAWL